MEVEETGFDLSIQRLELLEEQELESTQGQLSAELYTEMLVLYLYHKDYCNSKFLWKRIPLQIKTNSLELKAVWEIGKAFWKRNYASVFHNCREFFWSPEVKKIIEALVAQTQTQVVELVAKSYTNISMTGFCALLGITVEEATELVGKHNWTVSENKTTIYPVKKIIKEVMGQGSEEQLGKLTKFISFLETQT